MDFSRKYWISNVILSLKTVAGKRSKKLKNNFFLIKKQTTMNYWPNK